MSVLFVNLGDGKGEAIVTDDVAWSKAFKVWREWGESCKANTGNWPSLKESTEVLDRLYERYLHGWDDWDWADRWAWDVLSRLCEGSDMEPEPKDRQAVAEALRLARAGNVPAEFD